MTLGKEYLEKYKALRKEKDGVDISNQEATKEFNSLIMLVRNVYQPIPKSKEAEYRRLLADCENCKPKSQPEPPTAAN